jgi:uncharacterized protein (TIGR00251 family)
VIGEQNGALKIAILAPPDQGKANKALREALSEAFGVKRGEVELVAGASSRDKRFLIRGLTPEEVRGRLEEVLREP